LTVLIDNTERATRFQMIVFRLLGRAAFALASADAVVAGVSRSFDRALVPSAALLSACKVYPVLRPLSFDAQYTKTAMM